MPSLKPFPKGTIAGVGLGALAVGGTAVNYNNYQNAIEYSRRNAVRRYNNMLRALPVEKKAGFMGTLAEYARSLHPGGGAAQDVKDMYYNVSEVGVEPVTVSRTSDVTSVSFNGSDNPVGRLGHAAKTRGDDPGQHKAQALGAAAVTVPSTLAGVAALRSVPAADAKTLAAPGAGSLSAVPALALAGVPGAAYYTMNNLDRPKRAALGVLATGAMGALTAGFIKGVSGDISPAATKAITTGLAALGVGAGTGLYATHQLQKAEDAEKLRQIAISQMSDHDKAMEINRIRTGKDLYTRYPAVTWMPFSGKLREIYNRHHTPSPVVSKRDYETYIAGPAATHGTATEFIRSKIRE